MGTYRRGRGILHEARVEAAARGWLAGAAKGARDNIVDLADKGEVNGIANLGRRGVGTEYQLVGGPHLDLDVLGSSEGAGRGEQEGLLDSSEEHLVCVIGYI